MLTKLTRLSIDRLSLRNLTLLGFSLVAIPLVATLLFAANKLSQLAEQSTSSIFTVAKLIRLNTDIADYLTKVERSASQFIVLNDADTKQRYLKQHRALHQVIEQAINEQPNQSISKLLTDLQQSSQTIAKLLQQVDKHDISLEDIQQLFKQLNSNKIQLKQHTNNIINQQANHIYQSSEQARANLLTSLAIIPITLIIAIVFILLITKPLKRLIDEIKQLEQGNFKAKINFSGSSEYEEIALALETMRQRLHELELQKTSFIRHISHELKTPLAAIREGTELIYDHSVGDLNPEQQEICDIIKASVSRLQTLIEDLLDFNIVLDSTSLQEATVTELAPLIDKVIAQRQLDIKRKSLSIEKNLANLSLFTNATQLSVIIENLLSNAIKFSPEQGKITICAQEINNKVMLTISDQGPGISKEITEKIFDAFYQGPQPENSQIKGSGLGLTIVKELLSRLQAAITIANSKTGASFVISFEQATNSHVTEDLTQSQTSN